MDPRILRRAKAAVRRSPSHLRFPDGDTARKVIGALRAMARKERPRGSAKGPPAAA